MSQIRTPAALPDAGKSWRKLVTGVDMSRPAGYAVEGTFVQAAAVYQIHDVGLLLGVDEGTEAGNVVTLWQVDADGSLTQTWQVVRKGRWSGKATIKAIAKRCTRTPAWQARRLADGLNEAAGPCRRCGREVPAGAGVQWLDRYNVMRIGHRGRHCPPPPNRWPGMCVRCDGWMEPGEGIVAGYDDLTFRTLLAHAGGACPELPARAPDMPNRWEGRCARCHRMVAAEQGVYIRVRAVSLWGPRGYVRHTVCPGRGRRRGRPSPGPRGGRRPDTRRQATRPSGRANSRTLLRRQVSSREKATAA